MNTNAVYYNAFNLIGEIGPRRFKKLSGHFGDLKNAWTAGKPEILRSGIEETVADKIINARAKISPDREWEKLEKEKIAVIAINDKNYPKLLKETYGPPAMLYIKGQLSRALDFPLAVVGSRKISSYGKQATTDIVGGLARSGLSIISGMSYGVDMAAHETAILNGAKTVAVLASGLDARNLSPRKQIAEKIIANGALVSEYPFGKPAMKHQFPLRNRIIAGLAPAVLVIEAAEKSGSLITPRLALEANRDVFAVPGGIYWPNSQGTNNLIKQGAKAITSCQEILDELNLTKIADYTNNKRIVPDSPEEEAVCSLLSAEPLHIDAVARKAKMDASKIAGILMLMEMKGMVKNLGSGNYTVMK
jgi:DNA processing protein